MFYFNLWRFLVMNEDLVTISRLALTGEEADVRLFLAKHIRKIKKVDSETATELEKLLKQESIRKSTPLRRNDLNQKLVESDSTKFEEVSDLLKTWDSRESIDELLLSNKLKRALNNVVEERSKINLEILKKHHLKPISSIILQGPPGVGKSMTAKWLAKHLGLPLYILDLTSVMSSFMGKTGSNLRKVLDFAKAQPCILFLDEIDAIAKKRGDNSDVGELKRLVTVLLQEIENWPEAGLLLAATNHKELLDPALWRRFDLDLTYSVPTEEQIINSLIKLFDTDYEYFKKWESLLKLKFQGLSFSLIKREVTKLKKAKLMYPQDELEQFIVSELLPDFRSLSKSEQITFAVDLVQKYGFNQLQSSQITHISRDTLRKKLKENLNKEDSPNE